MTAGRVDSSLSFDLFANRPDPIRRGHVSSLTDDFQSGPRVAPGRANFFVNTLA